MYSTRPATRQGYDTEKGGVVLYPVAPAGDTRSNADSAARTSAPNRPMGVRGEPLRQPKPAGGDLAIDRLLPQRR